MVVCANSRRDRTAAAAFLADNTPMFSSYAQLVNAVLGTVSGICLFDGKMTLLGRSGTLDEQDMARRLLAAGWTAPQRRSALYLKGTGGECTTAFALEKRDGTLLGVLCVQVTAAPAETAQSQYVRDIAARLKPVLDCLYRELAAARPSQARMKVLTERTAELEWLFNITGNLKGAVDDREVVRELLRAATERLQCALGLLIVPDRRLLLEFAPEGSQGAAMHRIAAGMYKHLLAWAQRQRRPLVINADRATARVSARCKILGVPLIREGGRVIGLMAFFNPLEAADFGRRHVFLARHLGRQTMSLVDAQFDLMTGLYTRDGLVRMYGRDGARTAGEGSVVYVDIDRMQVVNELHGIELGNEVIVRIAELLGAPGLGEGALAARMSGDCFALVLPNTNTDVAREIALKLQSAAARLVVGPPQEPVEISISCGVALLTPIPQGLERALAAAQVAMKKAKDRGRNRVEIYACEDSSMMRYHEDAAAVGQLRTAIKADRLLLYAQRIVPLQNPGLPGGYELLMRLRDPDGKVVAPGSVIAAAQRYQLLPTIDRWAVHRALEMLTPYRGMLASRGISMSINISGQSIGDEEFVQSFVEQLQAARLPGGAVTVEITEQAAVTNLARAGDMIRRLGTLGCRLALDDFGTGANSLVNLKSLQIARVKIDGGFVRDIVADPRSQATVKAIVELARGYSIDTVAEYVENRSIAEVVRQLGVDYAQGYAFGQPEPLSELLASLGREESGRLHKLFLEM